MLRRTKDSVIEYKSNKSMETMLPSYHSQGAQGIAHDAATTEGGVEAQGVALAVGIGPHTFCKWDPSIKSKCQICLDLFRMCGNIL